MKIRRLTKEDKFEAFLISAFCFHNRIDDVEAKREEQEADSTEDWGAFTEDGTIMARILNNRYTFVIDGQEVKTGGIGAVSTLPEYRSDGCIAGIFKELLQAAYEEGEVISTLYPFSHSFYRKQGYETVVMGNTYEMPPSALSGYSFDGTVKKWNMGEDVAPYLAIYNTFTKGYNFAAIRDEKRMLDHMKVDKPYQDRKFSYLLSKDGKDLAYVIFTDIRHDPMAILDVNECAWTCPEGFRAVLAFLERFVSDYGTVRLPLPEGIDLHRIIRSRATYDVSCSRRFAFMVRAVNAAKLLEIMEKPGDASFVIEVTGDDQIPDNNGTYRVTGSCAEKVMGEKPDLSVSIQALSQLCCGVISLEEALLRGDTVVRGKEELLEKIFVRKKIFVGEAF
ncbi:MAG: GNAT family N-acetyltransferase [Lachnospiraceae bacterium]|nr:GNAT family N-acetyltransferase [Lachnospiraceae bacterium]